MPNTASEVVGVRFGLQGRLHWYRAAAVPAPVRSWVVAVRDGEEAVGQVIVGRGQCLEVPFDPATIPVLLRESGPDEIPCPPPTAGRQLLDSLR